jgi:hypothetical protein
MNPKLDEKSGADHVELITETHRSSEDASGPLFVLCRLAPILAIAILGSSRCPPTLAFLTVLALSFVDFFVTKSHFGPGLVGLHWYCDRTQSPTFPFIVFHTQPFPFVATTGNSNLFWIGLLVSAVADAIMALLFLVAGRIIFVIGSIALLVLTVVNISGFVKCYNIAKISADRAARSLLLDQNVTFQAANEANASDTDGEEEPGAGKGVGGATAPQGEGDPSDGIE